MTAIFLKCIHVPRPVPNNRLFNPHNTMKWVFIFPILKTELEVRKDILFQL